MRKEPQQKKPRKMLRPSEIAAKYLGQTEKPGNAGFNDAVFEKRMRDIGFKTGQAWCSYFCELVFKEAYPEKLSELDKLFSGSTLTTFRNFRDAAFPVGYMPQLDSMVIWQSYRDGKPLLTGHAGIVSKVIDNTTFESIEGNTSNVAHSREGFIVASHRHKVLSNIETGLRILGFVFISPPTNLALNV